MLDLLRSVVYRDEVVVVAACRQPERRGQQSDVPGSISAKENEDLPPGTLRTRDEGLEPKDSV